MKTIGILGGLGPESTVDYYKIIVEASFSRHGNFHCPPIVIHSFDFQAVIDAEYRVPGAILEALHGLAGAGADFAVAACNSIHLVYDEVAPKSPIPWVSIIDATAERLLAAGERKVALLGTRYTMAADFYRGRLARHGIEALVPGVAGQNEINDVIYDELVRRVVTKAGIACILGHIAALRDHGASAVVLACTELPYLFEEARTPVPVYDTARIHAEKALALALAGNEKKALR